MNSIFEKHICHCSTYQNKKEVMYTEQLTYDEVESIFSDVIVKINEKCDVLIDYFEEEELPESMLGEARKILEAFIGTSITDTQKAAAEKILRVIEMASTNKKNVCFDL